MRCQAQRVDDDGGPCGDFVNDTLGLLSCCFADQELIDSQYAVALTWTELWTLSNFPSCLFYVLFFLAVGWSVQSGQVLYFYSMCM